MAQTDGSFLTIGEYEYYVPDTPLTRIESADKDILKDFTAQLIPATAIAYNNNTFNDDAINAVFETFSRQDDVWSRSFVSVIILLQSSDLKNHSTCGAHRILALDNSKSKLPQGPFVIHRSTQKIYPVYRIYRDDHHAFLEGVNQKKVKSKKIQSFVKLTSRGDHISVIVPSRLYFTIGDDKPLAGLRFAVKDTIDVKGIRTGYGSAAYRALYGPAKTHAECVKKLLDAGAVMVGIVKTTEFAEGTDPHEWMEFDCPYNPRGDRQQHPSSSSTGSAVAAAAYKWLDFTVGTDTGGSIRHPAGVQGVFGSRTTHSAISLKGVLGASDLLNTVGVFARDANTFASVGRSLLPSRFSPTVPLAHRKYKLLYPVRAPTAESPDPFRWFPNPSDKLELSHAEKHMESFVEKLEAHLGCERVVFNIDELWHATRPKNQPETLDEAIGSAYATLTTYAPMDPGIEQFYADYAAQFDGKEPPIASIVKERLQYGQNLTIQDFTQALKAMRSFQKWVKTVVFGAYDEEAIALMVLPQSFGIPNYRYHVKPRTELFRHGFSVYAFGYLVGCPDYTVPVGEVPYLSEVTKRTEHLPVSVSMVARPGNDIPLFDILTSLGEKGGLMGVKAGSRMYD